MSNHKDSVAYSFYKRAEENLESGVATSNLVDKILKEVLKAVDYGTTGTPFVAPECYVSTIIEAVKELRDMGFKVLQNEAEFDRLYILWGFPEEDVEEEDNNANES